MSRSGRRFAALAAASLAIATMLGAYASHALHALQPRAGAAVEIAVQYQFYHGLGLLAVALIGERTGGRAVQFTGWLLVAGTVLFCGGIYLSSLLGIDAASRVTPLGGMAFIAGWATLAVALLRSRS